MAGVCACANPSVPRDSGDDDTGTVEDDTGTTPDDTGTTPDDTGTTADDTGDTDSPLPPEFNDVACTPCDEHEYFPTDLWIDSLGVLYLVDPDRQQLQRWSTQRNTYITPLPTRGTPSSVAYLQATHSLILGYDHEHITRIDLSARLLERDWAALAAPPTALQEIPPYVVAATSTGASHELVLLDADGSPVSSLDTATQATTLASAPGSGLLYGLDSQGTLSRFEITASTLAAGPTADADAVPPLIVSSDRVLTAAGTLHTADLQGLEPLTHGISQGAFTSFGLLTLRQTNEGTHLEHRGPDPDHVYGIADYPGEPLGIFESDYGIEVVTWSNRRPAFQRFTPRPDTDGDGYDPSLDAFPDDPAASLDSDRDGFPDRWNAGRGPEDSTQRLTLDSFPDDAGCWLPQHGPDGDCDPSRSIGAFLPADVAIDAQFVYLLNSVQQRIERWSLDSGSFHNPYPLAEETVSIVWHPQEDALFAARASGKITRVDPSTGTEQPFATLDEPPLWFGVAEDRVLAIYRAPNSIHIVQAFDLAGAPQERAQVGKAVEAVWSPTQERLYAIDHQFKTLVVVPLYTEVDPLRPTTVNLITGGATRAALSDDGRDLVLFASGAAQDPRTGQWDGNLPEPVHDAVFTTRGLFTIREHQSGSLLERWTADRAELLESRPLPHAPVAVLDGPTATVAVTHDGAFPALERILADDDPDNDGVPWPEDAFPFDSAASVDTDGDGYPDAWNAGASAPDSTTGLALDAWPQLAACWSAEHGPECDLDERQGEFVPSDYVVDQSTLYMTDGQTPWVRRYDLGARAYLDPIPTDGPPLALGVRDGMLYVGFASGEVKALAPENPLVQTSFGWVPNGVHALLDVDVALLVSGGPSGPRHHTFDSDGTLLSSVPSAASRELVYNAATERVYFAWWNQYQIHHYRVAPDGSLLAGGHWMEDPTPSPLVRPALDGKTVLHGSGVLYDAVSYEPTRALGYDLEDALYVEDGLYLLRAHEGGTRLDFRDDAFTLVDTRTLPGTPLRVLPTHDGIVVLTLVDGTPSFWHGATVPSGDSDGDGVPTVLDAFPFDPHAAEDTDLDGAPDAWIDGTPSDSLVLDAFPESSGCWLPEHGDPGCDPGHTVPAFVPDAKVVAHDVVHLLSGEHERLYRWSIATEAWLDPLRVDHGAISMAYSAHHDRIYIGHANGGLGSLDPTHSTREQPHSAYLGEVRNLEAADESLLLVTRWQGVEIIHTDLQGAESRFTSNTHRLDAILWHTQTQQTILLERDWLRAITWAGTNPAQVALIDRAGEPGSIPGLWAAPDGTTIVTSDGDSYDVDLSYTVGSLPYHFVDVAHLANHLLVLRSDGWVEQWDGLERLDVAEVPGVPVGLAQGSEVVVLSLHDGRLHCQIHTPTTDRDEDGVATPDDAFPLDGSAWSDIDLDGVADHLDGFPQDAACHAPAGGEPCDVASQIPDYAPRDLMQDAAGVIYLLDSEGKAIRRWYQGDHLSPIPLSGWASGMALAEADERLYVRYEDGRITVFDLQWPLTEELLDILPQGALGLEATGDWVFAIHPGPADALHVWLPDGTRATTTELAESTHLTWDPIRERLYFLQYSRLKAATFDSQGIPTVAPGGVLVQGPLRVAPSGDTILAGRTLYSSDFHIVDAFPVQIVDAAWNGSEITTLSENGSQTALRRYDSALSLTDTVQLPGAPLRVFETPYGTVAVTQEARPMLQVVP